MDESSKIPLLRQLQAVVLMYRFLIVAIMLIVIGGSLVLFATITPSTTVFEEFARDIGIALFTAGVIGVALEYYTHKQFQELVTGTVATVIESSSLNKKLDSLHDLISLGGDLRSLGVRCIHQDRTEIDFDRYLEEASPGSSIRMLGVCMRGFHSAEMQLAIENKLEQNCKFKLLMINPESEFVRLRAVEERREYEDIKTDIVASNNLHGNFINERLPPDLRENIELGHYDSATSFFIFSTDKIVIVGLYLRERLGEFFPHLELELRGGGIYLPFIEHFDSLWNSRQEVLIEK